MTDLATLQARLVEADTALHKLMTGTQAVSVQNGDKQVQYRSFASGIRDLRIYIAELKAQIAAAGGPGVRRRAIGVRG